MQMKAVTFRFFKQPKGFLAVTDQCPKGLQGIVFVAYAGPDPTAVKEIAVAPSQVRGEEVDLKDMPPEWLQAFGCPVPKPKAEVFDKTEPRRKKQQCVEIVVEEGGMMTREANRSEIVVLLIAAAITLFFLAYLR